MPWCVMVDTLGVYEVGGWMNGWEECHVMIDNACTVLLVKYLFHLLYYTTLHYPPLHPWLYTI